MSDASHGERTFDPTEQRREQFRKEGRFAQSKDIAGLSSTVAALGVLVAGRASLQSAFHTLWNRTIGDLGSLDRVGPMVAIRTAITPVVGELVVVLGAASVAAVMASLVQSRFRFNGDALDWKLDRLDPSKGFERLFAIKKNAVSLGLGLARAAASGGAAFLALSHELPKLLATSRAPLLEAAELSAGSLGRVTAHALVVLGVLAAFDYAVSYFTLEKEMKMTRQERVDESRQQDGDPKTKARMKARARAMAKKRALGGVKNADVIVTNPTHVAVALRYGAKDVAPVVVAKGHDDVALNIRAEGRKLGIPILENRALARALDAEVPVGRPIPAAHFAAVAQVLAFVYRLRRRGAIGGTKGA